MHCAQRTSNRFTSSSCRLLPGLELFDFKTLFPRLILLQLYPESITASDCAVRPGNNLHFRWTFNNTSELANIQVKNKDCYTADAEIICLLSRTPVSARMGLYLSWSTRPSMSWTTAPSSAGRPMTWGSRRSPAPSTSSPQVSWGRWSRGYVTSNISTDIADIKTSVELPGAVHGLGLWRQTKLDALHTSFLLEHQ